MNINSGISKIGRRMASATSRINSVWKLAVLAVILSYITWLASAFMAHQFDRHVRTALLTKSRMVAGTINPQRVKALTFTRADTANANFLMLRQQMVSSSKASGFTNIYSLARKGGRLYFGPESLAEDDPLASPPGTEYFKPPKELHEIITGSEEVVIVGPYTDEYGTFISAFAKVADPASEEMLMLVGIDVDYSVWLAEIGRIKTISFIILLIVLTFIGFGLHLAVNQNLVTLKIFGLYHYRGVLSVIVLGIALTVLAVVVVSGKLSENRQIAFRGMAAHAMEDVAERMRILRDHDLPSLQDFLAASKNRDASEFNVVTRRLIIDKMIGNVAWLPFDEKGGPDLAGMWTLERRPNTIGLKERTDGLEAILDEARETGMAAMGKINGRVFAGDTGNSVILAQPVHHEEVGSCKGFFLVEITPGLLLGQAGQNLDLSMIENPDNSSWMLGPVMKQRIPFALDELTERYPLFMFGKSFSVDIAAGSEFKAAHTMAGALVLGLAGISITILMGLLVAMFSNRQIVLERELEARTAELIQSKGQFQALFENMTNGAAYCQLVTDLEGRPSDFMLSRANQAFSKVTGLDPAELVGRKASQTTLWTAKGDPGWLGIFGRAALQREEIKFEMYSQHLGKWLYVSVYGAQPGHFVCLFDDISERKRIEGLARESQERMEAVFDSVQAGIMVVDRETHSISYINKAAASMVGLPAGEIVGRNCQKFVCSADIGACPITDKGMEVDNSERCLLRFDGRQLPVVKTVVEAEILGRPALVESFLDISDRVRMEQEIRTQSAFFEHLIDQIPNPVFYKDLKGACLGCNQAFAGMLGKKKDDVIGRTLFELAPSETAGIYRQMDQQLIESGGEQVYQADVVSSKQGPRSMMFSEALFRDEKGRPAGIVGSMVDLTEQHRIQTELKKLSVAVEQSPSIFVITDKQGRIEYVGAVVKCVFYDFVLRV